MLLPVPVIRNRYASLCVDDAAVQRDDAGGRDEALQEPATNSMMRNGLINDSSHQFQCHLHASIPSFYLLHCAVLQSHWEVLSIQEVRSWLSAGCETKRRSGIVPPVDTICLVVLFYNESKRYN